MKRKMPKFNQIIHSMFLILLIACTLVDSMFPAKYDVGNKKRSNDGKAYGTKKYFLVYIAIILLFIANLICQMFENFRGPRGKA
jgi:hypothetical protein